MFGWAIWVIVCFYTLIWTFIFLRDLAKGVFNIISPAYRSGRTIGELVCVLGLYSSLVITLVNILAKIHLLWLVPLSLLVGFIIGGCVVRIIINITNAAK